MDIYDQEQGDQKIPVPPFQIPLAFVTKQRFSELTGQDLGIIDAQVDRGLIPSKKIGKHRMVNLAKLWVYALSED